MIFEELRNETKRARLEDNITYVLYKDTVFKSLDDLENYLYLQINENVGLGKDWLLQEYESSEEIKGKDLKENLNNIELTW